MKMILGLVAGLVLTLGFSSDGFARGVHGGFAPAKQFSSTTSGNTLTITGQNGPQTVNSTTNPGVTTVVNNGTIDGGSSTALTTGPDVTSVVNNGTITSSTGGIVMTGGSSLTIYNGGTISVINSVSSGSFAKSTATGISIISGP